jgi:predicted nucleic acid-binding protein
MSGNNLLIDTNIALYLLQGDETIADVLNNKDVYISFISELELLGYQNITDIEKDRIKDFLSDCIVVDLNEAIKKITIELKQKQKIKLPDAIIAATSKYMNISLLTADSGFDAIEDIQVIKYIYS